MQMVMLKEMMLTIRRRQIRFLGHVTRRNEMKTVVLTRMVESRRAGRRQTKKPMDGVTKATRGHPKACLVVPPNKR